MMVGSWLVVGEGGRCIRNGIIIVVVAGESEVQAVSPTNRLALRARLSWTNVLPEAWDPRQSIRDSLESVTGGLFKLKKHPGNGW